MGQLAEALNQVVTAQVEASQPIFKADIDNAVRAIVAASGHDPMLLMYALFQTTEAAKQLKAELKEQRDQQEGKPL